MIEFRYPYVQTLYRRFSVMDDTEQIERLSGITLKAAAKSIVAIYKSKGIIPSDTRLPSDITRFEQDITARMDQQDKTIEK
ncbi:hypothetical protein CQ056_20620 [Peribacillus simplex]|nr:hypothetical protein CQ056_20620 [Peribacillus simplex]